MDIFGWIMFDPMYFVYVGPAILLALWAQFKVRSAYNEGSQHAARSGLTGAEAAQMILDEYGIADVRVEPVRSFLGDHYDPRHKVLRLSPDVYEGRSLAALGIAAHEAGHAIQHAVGYAPLAIRGAIVPVASVGSSFGIILMLIGMVLQFTQLAVVGLLFFAAVVLFQFVNLPVEFNASRRARAVLLSNGMVTTAEDRVVGKVLSAAALTYVAATVTALLQLLYFASIIFGGRRS